MKLLDRFLNGDERALSRVITLLENDISQRFEILDRLFSRSGRARCIGVTGPPGVGKSTFTDRLATLFRREGKSVGIIAVDPSSPLTGGALLGDRLRMQGASDDTDVFIRSLADRNRGGGLSEATPHAVTALDAFGKDVIMVETVGVGQSALDVAEVTDTTVVMLTPESGDSIQAMKAGMMEIADLLVVNKSDREGADTSAAELSMVVDMRHSSSEWVPPVLKVSARDNRGLDEVFEGLADHENFLSRAGRRHALRLRQAGTAIDHALDEWRQGRMKASNMADAVREGLSSRVAQREIHPLQAAREMAERLSI